MVLLPRSAFIGLEGFYIVESAEILHDYHNVSLQYRSKGRGRGARAPQFFSSKEKHTCIKC